MNRLRSPGCLLVFFLISFTESARILGVFPVASISHQVVFRALTQELAARGHELVVITTDPAYKEEKPPGNITEIDISLTYQLMRKRLDESIDLLKAMPRGVMFDMEMTTAQKFITGMLNFAYDMFDHPDVKKFMEDKTQTFDLIISEALVSTQLIFAKIFDAPVIAFSSFYGMSFNFEAMGALTHPILYPHIFRQQFNNLSFLDKIKNLKYEWKFRRNYKEMYKLQNEFFKKTFGPDAPTVEELNEYIQILFLNTHPIFDNNRPVPPSVVYLGRLHLKPVKELPKDLKTYLDSSKRGVIYVSLGTNVRVDLMEKELFEAFISAFKNLPYDILWKLDRTDIVLPDNIKTQKWFPQRDLLMHPNIKAFVTQGGLQSTDEAIDARVPLVGVPMIGDQWYNVNKYVELGIGKYVDAMTMKAKDLTDAVNTVINESSYKKNIIRLREIIVDQPQSPLERGVWWTEHVLRHKGAKHLRSPAHNMSWGKYFEIELLAVVVGGILSILVTVLGLLYTVYRCITPNQTKVKQS